MNTIKNQRKVSAPIPNPQPLCPNLLLFNLAMDADDPILGFTTEWVSRLAAYYTHVDVITMRAGRLAVPPNVRVFSVGKERGYSEVRRAFYFYLLLIRLLLTRRYTACFAHMMPLFALMGAPLLTVFRVRTTLWYTHRSPHWTVRWATRVVWRVVTAAPDSFPFITRKKRVIGHGIDTAFFHPSPDVVPQTPAQVVQVARLMPIKHQDTLIHALAHLHDLNAHVIFVGSVPPEQNAGYANSLQTLAAELGVQERVTFAGDQPREGVRNTYQAATVAVNLSPIGLFDKAALEAMACGLPTIVSNPAFDDLLGVDRARLRIDTPEDVNGLAAQLRNLLQQSGEERRTIGERLRVRVEAAHSLDTLIVRLVKVLSTGEF